MLRQGGDTPFLHEIAALDAQRRRGGSGRMGGDHHPHGWPHLCHRDCWTIVQAAARAAFQKLALLIGRAGETRSRGFSIQQPILLASPDHAQTGIDHGHHRHGMARRPIQSDQDLAQGKFRGAWPWMGKGHVSPGASGGTGSTHLAHATMRRRKIIAMRESALACGLCGPIHIHHPSAIALPVWPFARHRERSSGDHTRKAKGDSEPRQSCDRVLQGNGKGSSDPAHRSGQSKPVIRAREGQKPLVGGFECGFATQRATDEGDHTIHGVRRAKACAGQPDVLLDHMEDTHRSEHLREGCHFSQPGWR